MQTDFEAQRRALEDGHERAFRDWPATHFEIGPAGVYSVWHEESQLHPLVADVDPRIRPLSKQEFDPASIDIVVNTHLHFDHCGGNHLFAGKAIYVQRQEFDDALSQDDYTIREWVEAPGVRYMLVDDEYELLPGIRLVPGPGHSRGSQMVVIESGPRPVVVAGDLAISSLDLDEPQTVGQLRVRALDPDLVWLAHQHEPWTPNP